MGDFAAINTALTGLLAHRRALETISHNIANAKTDGFTRRRAELSPLGAAAATGVWANAGDASIHGVEVTGITRLRDELLDQQVRRELGADANTSRAAEILAGIEQLMPEPSDDGIAAKLAAFWGAWDDAAARPNDIPTRQALLQNADNLATTFHRLAASFDALRGQLQDTLSTSVAQINADAIRVAELNNAIVAATAAGADAGDLQDQRDLIVDRLAKATGATSRAGEFGSVSVFLGGSTLVRDGEASALSVATGGALDPPLNTMGLNRTELRWSLDGYPVASLGGDSAALLAGINETVPSYLHEIDGLAAAVVSQVNTAHQSGHGLDTIADVNLNFFDPAGVTAATMGLSTDIAGQPSRVALAAGSGGDLDATLAHQIAALGDSSTGPDALHRALVSKLAIDVNVATNRSTVQTRITERAESERESIAGVSLDEEMTNLIATQHAFEASSRVLTAVDEMLDVLINRTGAVGR